MKRLALAIAAAALVLVPAGVAMAAGPAPTVVAAGWEQVEYFEMADGTVLVRARKAAVSSAPAPASAAAAVKQAAAAPPAADKDPKAISDQLKDRLAVDLSIPSSPAMAVLGMTGTEIQRPAFPRDFAASLVRGFDKDGKAKNTLAMDIVPVALFYPGAIIGGERYEGDYWMRLKARTTVSLAAAQLESSKPASQYAAGIRLGLMDGADPGLHWRVTRDCVNAAIRAVPISKGRTTEEPPEDAAAVAAAVAKTNECSAGKLVADLWAKPALYAGYAQAAYSGGGSVKDATGSAKALWVSYSIGLNPRTQYELQHGVGANGVRALMQVYLARKIDDRVKDPAGTESLVREDRSEALARLRLGKTQWHAFIDAGLSRVTTAGLPGERIRRLGIGIEYQIREDLWLVAGSVTEKGYAGGDRNLVNTGLRFGQVPKAQFGLPGAQGE